MSKSERGETDRRGTEVEGSRKKKKRPKDGAEGTAYADDDASVVGLGKKKNRSTTQHRETDAPVEKEEGCRKFFTIKGETKPPWEKNTCKSSVSINLRWRRREGGGTQPRGGGGRGK